MKILTWTWLRLTVKAEVKVRARVRARTKVRSRVRARARAKVKVKKTCSPKSTLISNPRSVMKTCSMKLPNSLLRSATKTGQLCRCLFLKSWPTNTRKMATFCSLRQKARPRKARTKN